jgi:hypothetical protein
MIVENPFFSRSFEIPGPNQAVDSGTITIESVSVSPTKAITTNGVTNTNTESSIARDPENPSIFVFHQMGASTLYTVTLEINVEGWSFFQTAVQFGPPDSGAGMLVSRESATSVTFSIYNTLQQGDPEMSYVVAVGLIHENDTTPVWFDDPTFVLKPPD